MKTTQSRLLSVNEVCRIDAKAVDVLSVESGAAWVTVTGCVQDLFLQAGDSLVIAKSGLTVVEGLSNNTSIHLQPKASGARQSIGFAMLRFIQAHRSALERVRKFVVGNESTAPSL